MFTEEMAFALLKEKHTAPNRIPKKEDFSAAEVSRIKSGADISSENSRRGNYAVS